MTKILSIIFLYTLLTAIANAADQASRTNNNYLKGYITKYYCQEFSTTPPVKKNWREFLMTELTPEKYPLLFENDVEKGAPSDLIKFCPNYTNLRDEQKKIILMRILDGMVFFESSCKSNASARGPNGTAYGILQLHLGREHAYAAACKNLDSKNPKRSLICSLDMLHNQIENSKRLFSSGSYWEVLRPKGASKKATTIANHIWYYPLCQPQ